MYDEPKVVEGEYITREDRIAELRREMDSLQGSSGGTGAGTLAKVLQNPGALRGMFNLSDAQAANVKALIAGTGGALGLKYLRGAFGDELSAALGAAAAAWMGRKLVG